MKLTTTSKNTPKNISKKSYLSLIALTSGLLLGSVNQMAQANTNATNQIQFSTQSQSVVDNDEIVANLSKKVQAKNSKDLAPKLNTAINQAISITKKYPMVKVSTGSQNTTPIYDKNNKIIGWTAEAGIKLVSQDTTATSELISDLQPILVLDNLSFRVSSQKQEQVINQLMVDVSKAFQKQSETLAKAWNAKGYRLINLEISPRNYYPLQPVMFRREGLASESFSENTPNQSFEAGTSTIGVTASGQIELTP